MAVEQNVDAISANVLHIEEIYITGHYAYSLNTLLRSLYFLDVVLHGVMVILLATGPKDSGVLTRPRAIHFRCNKNP
jgi:hypothetical protein